MVSARSNSSYSSNFLTKQNNAHGSPLTRVGGQVVPRNVPHSTTIDSTPRRNAPGNKKRAKFEPATDDEPLSSTDESEELNYSRAGLSPSPEPRRRSSGWSAKVSARKSSQQAEDEETDKPVSKRRKKEIITPRKGRRRSGRTKSSPVGSPEERLRRTFLDPPGKDMFPLSSQPNRAMKNPTVYGSNIHTAPKNGPPSRFKHPPSTFDDDDLVPRSSQASAKGPEFQTPLVISTDFTTSSSITVPSHLDDILDDLSSSPLSSISSSIGLHLSQEEKQHLDSATQMPKTTLCPICDQVVDPRFVDELQNLSGLNYRKKAQFCRNHTRKAAEREWVDRGYPTIDWENLHKRIEKHYAELDQILTCKKPSFYRNVLESARSGERRGNLRLTVHGDGVDKISTGYYGPWGAKKMMDAIIGHFALKFNSLAPTDTLIKAAGVSGFVQSVMVPELAVMLIKEDMSIGDTDARLILTDSMEIGNLLNEQPDDVIKRVVRK
ncbi:hypothetical protein ACO22_00221 [Paracoccidioides brasiliensis]|uniref:Restriction of telomere capping protein 4 n=1 Tax=Paracoccidioides brasiliensis TaxID=121759 RepID=A0A1D2JPX0_PARBR|nr:hypothetical protein ACO22_00221 [Paracoccidioides brasiliensis]